MQEEMIKRNVSKKIMRISEAEIKCNGCQTKQ